MLDPRMVSAILVTRGDVDLVPIISSLPYDEIIIWDNSKGNDLKVYGRFEAISEAQHPVIYVQDDDCVITAHEELMEAYEPGKIVANMPTHRTDYTDSCLIGWGALFDRDLIDGVFDGWKKDAEFLRCCDVIFTHKTPFKRVDLGHENLPQATAHSRMYKQPTHFGERQRVLDKCRQIADSTK